MGLAKRLVAEKADIAVVEADIVNGPVFELPLVAVAPTRGDPNNVDVAAATAAGVPVLRAPGVTQTQWQNLPSAFASLSPGPSCPLTATSGRRRCSGTGRSPTSASVDGSWRAGGGHHRVRGSRQALEWRLRGTAHGLVSTYDPYVAGAGHDMEGAVRRSRRRFAPRGGNPGDGRLLRREQFSWMRSGLGRF